ncbi:hypothetical protein ABLE92_13490 [Gordonia sp. VNQ95]|uniref:hypothetical protein n=1 Tax=Gordonia sp. VNQ95 TaxID=3156619 RepID=UPI0032B3D707
MINETRRRRITVAATSLVASAVMCVGLTSGNVQADTTIPSSPAVVEVRAEVAELVGQLAVDAGLDPTPALGGVDPLGQLLTAVGVVLRSSPTEFAANLEALTRLILSFGLTPTPVLSPYGGLGAIIAAVSNILQGSPTELPANFVILVETMIGQIVAILTGKGVLASADVNGVGLPG